MWAKYIQFNSLCIFPTPAPEGRTENLQPILARYRQYQYIYIHFTNITKCWAQ